MQSRKNPGRSIPSGTLIVVITVVAAILVAIFGIYKLRTRKKQPAPPKTSSSPR